MLDPRDWSVVEIPRDQPPLLAVVVDTEEEFDWGEPLARANTRVSSSSAQVRAHRIFERYGLKPTYVVDYPVASKPEGFGPLRELLADGLCEIGSHLHPWVTPPFDEQVCPRNSYPGNLPAALEREKLRRLTAVIEDSFGLRPVVYKAGRYGVGPATTGILEEVGYRIDTSVVPPLDLGEAIEAPPVRSPLGELPRAVNYISGPSRTADIEQTLVLGAHGPYRVHIVLVG